MEALHYGALLPAFAAVLYRTRIPRGTVLVAAAFAVSWAGDGFALFTGGAWYTSYLWLPVQFGLVLWAVVPGEVGRLKGLVGLLLAAGAGVVFLAPAPDMLVTVAGAVLVVPAALHDRHPLALAIVLYFGLGSALYLVMVSHVNDPAGFGPWWWAYQLARVAGWGAFLWAIWRHQRHQRTVPEETAP